jgi:2-iminobutanoate/2-iminopropanoate deaminase
MIQTINSSKAPKAVGPYSQAIKAGGFIYFSGQIALNPETGNLENKSIEIETTQVLNNLKTVLQEANCTFENVVRSEIFVVEVNKHFGIINKIYEVFFGDHKPARFTVGVAELPKGATVEIALVAYKQ